MEKKYKAYNSLKLVSIPLYKLTLVIIIIYCCSSCKKYLDIKSDKKLEVPATLQDCQALLANSQLMTEAYPDITEVTADNYYITFQKWDNLVLSDKESYIWKADANVKYGLWYYCYQRVLTANQVLETLGKIIPSEHDQITWNTLKGAALFFRALSFSQVAQTWAKSYDKATAGEDLGIPIRLTPDLSESTDRGTLQHTYDQIIKDFKDAVDLLPAQAPTSLISKRVLPTRAAAFAALARIYLAMEDYTNAGTYANECLKQYNVLMDYKLRDTLPRTSMLRFNEEVIFDIENSFNTILLNAKIDTFLYASYQINDARRNLFFASNADGSHAFKGGYSGSPSYTIFLGFATDEIYLIRAECYARAGNMVAAMDDLNTLMKNRWRGVFVPFTAADSNEALALILQERRKELLFRGIRWTDLRRLNKDTHFATTLKRNLNGQEYVLPPNDLRYVLRIPNEVLSRVNIPQNPR